jgi:hypothetical protein
MKDRKDELRRQFGTVWRMAQGSFQTMREVVVRSSQAGRLRVDVALLQRERAQLQRQLGEQVARLFEAGRIDLPEDARELCERLADLETRIRSDLGRIHDNAFGAPRGYEPEAGNFDDEDPFSDPSEEPGEDLDEHAELAEGGRTKPSR